MTKARDLASIPAGSGDFSVDSNTLFVDASADSVGVGTNAPNLSGQDKALTIKTTNSNSLVALELEGNRDSDGNTIGLIRGDNNGNRITQINFIRGANANDGKIRFFTTSAGTLAEAATFNESGNLVFPSGQGIDFSAVTGGTGTPSSNILDDYEEGTFTPRYSGTISSPAISHDIQIGSYAKIGQLVYFQIFIGTDSVSGGSGDLIVNDLPFTVLESNTVTIGQNYAFAIALGGYATTVGSNTYIKFWQSNSATENTVAVLGTGTNDNRLSLAGCYLTT